jgi:arylsulfatase A-like enzyme
LLALTEVGLLAAFDNSVLHVRSIPGTTRILFAAQELLSLAFMSMSFTGLLILLGRLVRSQGAIIRVTVRVLIACLGGAGLFLFLASWTQFHSTGRFLDWDGLAFFSTNSVQLVQHLAHIEPYVLASVPVAFLGFGLLLAYVSSRLDHLPAAFHCRIAPYTLAILLLLVIVVLGGREQGENDEPVVDSSVGTVFTMEDLYTECRLERSGPAIHAVADLLDAVFHPERTINADSRIEIERRPVISMKEYLNGVDHGRVNRWNVIVVVVESLRTDQLQAGGSSFEVMPNVEAVARFGRTFIENYTQASHSNYADLCPLSSHYPLRSSRTHVYPKQPTYPRVLIHDILKALGYRTAVISSQDENWGGMINYLNTGNVDHFFHSANFTGPTYTPYGDCGVAAWIKGAKRSGKIDDRYTVSEAVRWTGLRGETPFCLYINLQKSHVPYETPADFPRRFGLDKLPFSLGFNQFPVEHASLVKQVYSNSLAYVDFQLGRLIDALKRRDHWNRTILVVTGDTGQAFFEHGFAAHANKLFNEVMKVPVLLSAPGLSFGVDTRLAQHVDIPPTLLELLGLPPHPSFQGISLLRRDPSPEHSVYLVAQTPLAHQYAVVRRGMKLIYDARTRRHVLFDLKNDPGETLDVAAAYPEIAQALSRRLDTWRKLQIEYYSNLQQHRTWYPPVLKD